MRTIPSSRCGLFCCLATLLHGFSTMIIGTLKLRLLVREARSLKDKRRVISSIKERIRSTFNVSVAEVEAQEAHQQAVLGVAVVTNERRFAQEMLTKVVNLVRSHPVAQLVDYELEA